MSVISSPKWDPPDETKLWKHKKDFPEEKKNSRAQVSVYDILIKLQLLLLMNKQKNMQEEKKHFSCIRNSVENLNII